MEKALRLALGMLAIAVIIMIIFGAVMLSVVTRTQTDMTRAHRLAIATRDSVFHIILTNQDSIASRARFSAIALQRRNAADSTAAYTPGP